MTSWPCCTENPVGGDIGDLLAAGKAARGDRVKREYLGRSGPGFTDADAEQGGEAGKVALAEHFEPIARDLQRQRVERAALRELEREAVLGPYSRDEVYIVDMERFHELSLK